MMCYVMFEIMQVLVHFWHYYYRYFPPDTHAHCYLSSLTLCAKFKYRDTRLLIMLLRRGRLWEVLFDVLFIGVAREGKRCNSLPQDAQKRILKKNVPNFFIFLFCPEPCLGRTAAIQGSIVLPKRSVRSLLLLWYCFLISCTVFCRQT